MRIPLNKPRLADILWPALLAKLHIEFAGEHAPTTPVIKLIDDITRIHHHMDGIRAMQPPTARQPGRTADARMALTTFSLAGLTPGDP